MLVMMSLDHPFNKNRSFCQLSMCTRNVFYLLT